MEFCFRSRPDPTSPNDAAWCLPCLWVATAHGLHRYTAHSNLYRAAQKQASHIISTGTATATSGSRPEICAFCSSLVERTRPVANLYLIVGTNNTMDPPHQRTEAVRVCCKSHGSKEHHSSGTVAQCTACQLPGTAERDTFLVVHSRLTAHGYRYATSIPRI